MSRLNQYRIKMWMQLGDPCFLPHLSPGGSRYRTEASDECGGSQAGKICASHRRQVLGRRESPTEMPRISWNIRATVVKGKTWKERTGAGPVTSPRVMRAKESKFWRPCLKGVWRRLAGVQQIQFSGLRRGTYLGLQ